MQHNVPMSPRIEKKKDIIVKCVGLTPLLYIIFFEFAISLCNFELALTQL
jgi:hypothetical protein